MPEKIQSSTNSKPSLSFRLLDTHIFGQILKILQLIFWAPPVKLIALFIVKKKTVNPQLKPDRNKTFIIASNHQSAFDHFMILACLPLNFLVKESPYRFMTLHKYFTYLPFRIFLIFCGSFPAKPIHNHIFGLEAADKLIKMKHTVLIYPEGTRTLPGEKKPKNGVTVLAKMDNVMVIPAKIMWYKKSKWRRRCTVSIDAPVDAKNMSAQDIMDSVYRLP